MKKIRITLLDVLFSRVVRLKADYICEVCGQKKSVLHCSHFIGRRYRNTRWLEDNACCVCYSCHNYLDEHPRIHSEFFKKRIGSDRIEQLEILAHSGVKVDLDEIKEQLQGKLRIYSMKEE